MHSTAKSSNAFVRVNSVHLLEGILSRRISDDIVKQLAEAVILPISSGKTTGPDHRNTLYSMLLTFPVSPATAQIIVKAIIPLLEKETNDTSLAILAETLSKHLAALMRDEKADQSMLLSISKEVSSSKVPQRRAATTICGEVLWELSRGDAPWPQNAEKLLESILPALEKILKDTPTAAITGSQSPADAWITVAILVGSSKKCAAGTREKLPSTYYSSILNRY